MSSSSLKKQKGRQLLQGNTNPTDPAQTVQTVHPLVQDLRPVVATDSPGESGACQEASHLEHTMVSRNFTVPPDHQNKTNC